MGVLHAGCSNSYEFTRRRKHADLTTNQAGSYLKADRITEKALLALSTTEGEQAAINAMNDATDP